MAAALAFSITNRFLNSRALLFPSVSSNPLVISKISTVSYLSTKDAGHHMKLKNPSRASAEGIPGELMDEDSKFVPLNAEDSAYGPPEVAKSLPRICFLSGLSGEEMMMFIDAFPETGLEPAVFAALVPNSADKPLEELIEEIMGDHEMLAANQPGSTEAKSDST